MQHAIRVAALFVLLAFGAIPAQAQSFSIVELPGGCGTGNITSNSLSYLTVDSGLKLCVNATATLGGFTATATGTPISVTTGGVSGTLPAGAEVVATNVGTTNGAYCALGASATTSSQYIAPNGGWFAFAVGASTQLTCITSTSTTTVNTTGGSGLPTGTGGGGGGSSSNASVSATGSGVPASATYAGMNVSGNLTGLTGTANGLKVDGSAVTQPVSVASGQVNAGAYAAGALAAGAFATGAGVDGWDLTQGAQANSVCATATGTCSVVSLLKFLNNSISGPSTGLAATAYNTNSYTNATTSSINTDLNGGIYTNTGLNRLAGTTLGAPSNFGTSPGAVEVPGANASLFYGNVPAVGDPCHTATKTTIPISITTATTTNILVGTASVKTYVCHLFLTSAAADNVAVIQGTTGGTCGSSTLALLGGTTAANGMNFAANGGVSLGNGESQVLQTTVANNDICIITSAGTPLAGSMTYVKQ